ncbi:MAG: aminotransferase class V-fold PLP-dependent enzyme, partial [Candidatus Hydrogenedentota bacterium]
LTDAEGESGIPDSFHRKSSFLQADVFHRYHSETAMMRYLKKLENRDLSLTHSMISLGSCTMKLNAAAEMLPLSWPEVQNIHPFTPPEFAKGYYKMIQELGKMLLSITGFSAYSFQPNSGAQGELAGICTILDYHASRGDTQRKVTLIPSSAHGTNPASAVMAGSKVVVVKCDKNGNVDIEDLANKCNQYKDELAAFMITYPSTHGVFETSITQMCDLVHEAGGLVYLDGANMNAQVMLTSPAKIGADVCHLNLHKTFAIPHGGGGPGMGPIFVTEKLAPFLPGHRFTQEYLFDEENVKAVAAAPFGSPSILWISYAYILLLGSDGLEKATKVAILNANYLAEKLESIYPILFRGENGRVAHELILDLRQLKKKGVEVEDVAKRLMDYGFHAPTMSWPVIGTMMIEPTESEPKEELDRFIRAMDLIAKEVEKISIGVWDKQDNPLKQSPHPADEIASDNWSHPYSREEAAYPAQEVVENKFWPFVSRVDNVYGDRNLFCTCNVDWDA